MRLVAALFDWDGLNDFQSSFVLTLDLGQTGVQ
jgi:hypothetical protein